MDLSKLSTEDLQALKNGDLTKVSTDGLQALKAQSTPEAPTDASVTQDSGMSTPAKVGIGLLGAGAAVAALKYPELRGAIENLAARAGIRAAEVPLWKQAGLRTAENSPIARNMAGHSGQEALQEHTRDIARTIAANEAGLPAAQEPWLSQDILTDARRAPSSVYDRLANVLPTSPLDADAQKAIQSGGNPGEGRITQGSPKAQVEIENLRQQLLDPNRQFTGQQFINEVRGLRQEGYNNVASDDVSNQQLGRAQLDFARAVDGHIERNIPQGAEVTADQYKDARKTLAKNATIQNALRGNDVDLSVLARIQRNDPQLLDGGTKMLADFYATHPEVATLPSTAARYSPPGFSRDLNDISLKNPTSWFRPFYGAGARSSLVGDIDAARAQANQMFPPRDTGSFSPPPPPPGSIPFRPPPPQGLSIAPPPSAALPTNPDMIPFENVLVEGGTQGKPIGGIKSGYRPAPQSPKGPNMRTPPGSPELTEYTPTVPSDAQNAFRNQLAADRLRKIAGDLRMEGPGGSEGSPQDRLRAALERRQRGYAEGGEVHSSSPGSPGFGGAVKDAVAALKDYFIDTPKRRLQAAREAAENTVVDDTAQHAPVSTPQEDYADGGGVPSLSQQEAIEQSMRALSDLVSLHENAAQAEARQQTQGMAGGGRVELAEALEKFIQKISDSKAARDVALSDRVAPTMARPPLVQAPVTPPAAAAAPPLIAAPTVTPAPFSDPDALLKRQAFADGGSTDDTHSSVRKLADYARNLNPYDKGNEDRARLATNLASLVYGLDAQGNPALGGRAWTKSQGGTPAGILDAITAIPHNLVQVPAIVSGLYSAATQALPTSMSHYLPKAPNPQFWSSHDPQWSQDAAARLGQLKARMQQAGGVKPPTDLTSEAINTLSDPSVVTPFAAAKLAKEGSALRSALNWSQGSSPGVTQGH